ncbi:hypothetical protein SpCBS45565_g02567 [Spizellomyces sp. 'palustris']|nr:hypothetical protein SpCBS45565_g02567 [Spizellomyces sp. 'palustris']
MSDQPVASAVSSADTEESSPQAPPISRRPEEVIKKAVSSVSDFGTRYLQHEEDVYNFNAWDNVIWDEEQERSALELIAKQAENKVPDGMRTKYEEEAPQFWDQFYAKNANRFFKDRHWLRVEFPEIFEGLPKDSSERYNVFEIGCGAGNTVFPLLNEAARSNVFVYACDYSKVAVDVVKSNPEYNESKCHAFVYDITSEQPPDVEPGSIDVCICIFVLSAIHPSSWETAVKNIWRILKPGGLLLFRDYGRYDLAQLRFKGGRMLEENFYIRGDGTRVFFFDQADISTMFKDFIIEQNAVDRRLIVNRSHGNCNTYPSTTGSNLTTSQSVDDTKALSPIPPVILLDYLEAVAICGEWALTLRQYTSPRGQDWLEGLKAWWCDPDARPQKLEQGEIWPSLMLEDEQNQKSDYCQETLKKAKLDQHRAGCRQAQFTCIDCSTTFQGTNYRAHTSCISEAEKYQGALYKGAKKVRMVPQIILAPLIAHICGQRKWQQNQQNSNANVKSGNNKDEGKQTNGTKENIAKAPTSESLISQIKKSEEAKTAHASSETGSKRPRDEVTEDTPDEGKKKRKSKKAANNVDVGKTNGVVEVALAVLKKNHTMSISKLRKKVVKKLSKENKGTNQEELEQMFYDHLVLTYQNGAASIKQ